MYYTANFFTLTPATPPYFSIHDPPVPEALPEVPAETGEAVEEAELEEIADARILSLQCSEIFNSLGQPLLQRDFRFPTKQLFR